MNNTTTTTGSAHSKGKRAARSFGLALGAVAAATVATASLGFGPTAAQADPGDTFVAIGSSQLVQSEDLSAIQVPLNNANVVTGRNPDFSSCLGEGNSWTAVLKGSPKPITVAWTRRGHRDELLFEAIAQAKTVTQAKSFEKILLTKAVNDCRKPVYDFHYGPTTAATVGEGNVTWALSYRGRSTKPDGGVVVIRKGTNVGIVEVTGTWGPADQTLESVAKVAVDRLVVSS